MHARNATTELVSPSSVAAHQQDVMNQPAQPQHEEEPAVELSPPAQPAQHAQESQAPVASNPTTDTNTTLLQDQTALNGAQVYELLNIILRQQDLCSHNASHRYLIPVLPDNQK